MSDEPAQHPFSHQDKERLEEIATRIEQGIAWHYDVGFLRNLSKRLLSGEDGDLRSRILANDDLAERVQEAVKDELPQRQLLEAIAEEVDPVEIEARRICCAETDDPECWASAGDDMKELYREKVRARVAGGEGRQVPRFRLELVRGGDGDKALHPHPQGEWVLFDSLPLLSEGVGEDGASLIAAERRRQVEAEGWTPEHDDGHDAGELAQAAAAYALVAGAYGLKQGKEAEQLWPFADDWKPSGDPIRDLTKAGALIAAEIDRLCRARAEQPDPTQQPAQDQCEANSEGCDWLRCELPAGHDGDHRTSIGIESGVRTWPSENQEGEAVVSAPCKEERHGHCPYWVCGGRCTCTCHGSPSPASRANSADQEGEPPASGLVEATPESIAAAVQSDQEGEDNWPPLMIMREKGLPTPPSPYHFWIWWQIDDYDEDRYETRRYVPAPGGEER